MKYYKSETGEVFAYEADGSQDAYIKPQLTQMTAVEVYTHLHAVFAEVGSNYQQIGGNCPDGWIAMQGERPSPDHVAKADGSWALPSPDYPSQIAARRYEAEVGGITLNGMEVATSRDSQALITGAALQATIDPAYTVRWKTGADFVELNAEQIIGMATSVRAHVQACFDRESELVEAVNAGTYTADMLDQGWPV